MEKAGGTEVSESPEIIGSTVLDLPDMGYREVTDRLKVLGDLLDKARSVPVPIHYMSEDGKPHAAEQCVCSLLMAIASVAEYSSCLCVSVESNGEELK